MKNKNNNVLIPCSLFNRIIDLLGYWDVSNYDEAIQFEHFDVLLCLNWKKQKLQLRNDYSKIIHANSESSRDDARISYLQNRAMLRDD